MSQLVLLKQKYDSLLSTYKRAKRIMEAWKRFMASPTFLRAKAYYLRLRGSKERRAPSPDLLRWVAIIVYCVIVFAIIAYIIWE